MSAAVVGIDRKIERAKEHINELEAAIQKFWGRKPYAIVTKDDPQDPDRVNLCLAERWKVPAVEFAAIIGDAVHNLRASLDYLACGLVEAGNGTVKETTAFPIWRRPRTPTAKELKSLVYGKVQGARRDDIKKLLTLEPYPGGNHERLWTVDCLDVVDKHRLLIVAGVAHSSVSVNMGSPRLLGRESEDLPDTWIRLRPADRYPIKHGDALYNAGRGLIPKHQPKFTFDIALGEPEVVEGEPIIPTLVQLTEAVTEIIDLFRGDLS